MGEISVRERSVWVFILVLILFAAPMGYSVFSAHQIQVYSSNLQDKIYPALNLTSKIIDSMHKTREDLLTAVSESDEDFIDQGVLTAERFRKNLYLLQLITQDEELETVGQLFEHYMEKSTLAAQTSVNGSSLEEMRDTIVFLNNTASKLNELMDKIYKETYKTFAFNVNEINRLSNRFIYVILITFVTTSFIIGIVLGKHVIY